MIFIVHGDQLGCQHQISRDWTKARQRWAGQGKAEVGRAGRRIG